MASMIALAVLMTFLFGGMMLALIMGYIETEKTRQKQAQGATEGVARAAEDVPWFLARLDEAPKATVQGADHNGFKDSLEGYLRAEEALVAQFVKEPTIDNLYRQATVSLSVH